MIRAPIASRQQLFCKEMSSYQSPLTAPTAGEHTNCRGLCHAPRTARPALRRWDPDLIPMTFFPLPWQHPFARTFRSRRRPQLTLVPANTGTTSPTSPRSGHRAPRPRPVVARGVLRRFAFPEDARWNAERQAVEFRVEISEYRGVVPVPRRVFQRLSP